MSVETAELPRLKINSPQDFFLLPYPIVEDASNAWRLSESLVRSGRQAKFINERLSTVEEPEIIMGNNEHLTNIGPGLYTVGSSISFGPTEHEIPRQVRALGSQQGKKILENGRFSRGVKHFVPSPRDEIAPVSGQWIPGTIPGEYNWRGMGHNPMEKY